jgi:hypothetical protein
MPGIAIWQFDQASVFALYVGFMSILVGLIEVPFLCTCMGASISGGRGKISPSGEVCRGRAPGAHRLRRIPRG